MAPGAHLINLRVLDDDGAGQVADVIEAIDWAIENRGQYNIRVINLSLGTPVTQSYRDDPLGQAVERAVKAGIVVVASAGNRGETPDGKTVLVERQLARQLALTSSPSARCAPTAPPTAATTRWRRGARAARRPSTTW